MKKNPIRIALAAALLVAAGSCSTATTTTNAPVADREAIQRALPIVTAYENKREELKKAIGFLFAHGLLDRDSGKQVKESMDIEYVYYEASIISLPQLRSARRKGIGPGQDHRDRKGASSSRRAGKLNPSRSGSTVAQAARMGEL